MAAQKASRNFWEIFEIFYINLSYIFCLWRLVHFVCAGVSMNVDEPIISIYVQNV